MNNKWVDDPSLKDWEAETIFKDSVMGYIYIPKAVVKKIIDHRIFQRLHDIAQTGMEVLYPSATHNRFCHSIGVYHLGKQAFTYFEKNIQNQYGEEIYSQIAHNGESEDVWYRWRFLFEMACLLHDCGHAPLSHTLEFVYDANLGDPTDTDKEAAIECNKLLLESFGTNSNFRECFCSSDKRSAPHERMSALLLIQKDGYYTAIYDLMRSYMRAYYIKKNKLKEADAFPEQYTPSVYKSDLEFMVRMIIGCEYNANSTFWGYEGDKAYIVYQIRNCIIRLLNSNLDVDNLDYTIRDANVSGYKSAQVDYERLIKGQTIALAYEIDDPVLIDIPDFDGAVILRSFQTKATEESPVELIICGSCTIRVTCPNRDIVTELKLMGNITEDGGDIHSEKDVRIIHTSPDFNARIRLRIGNLEIVPRKDSLKYGARIHLRGHLNGYFRGMMLVDQSGLKSLRKCVGNPLRDKLHVFSAYHKSALSVIQGALDATNFEYTWIYPHHVTTYTNNFLSIYLLEEYANYQWIQECSLFLDDLFTFLDHLEVAFIKPSCTNVFARVAASTTNAPNNTLFPNNFTEEISRALSSIVNLSGNFGQWVGNSSENSPYPFKVIQAKIKEIQNVLKATLLNNQNGLPMASAAWDMLKMLLLLPDVFSKMLLFPDSQIRGASVFQRIPQAFDRVFTCAASLLDAQTLVNLSKLEIAASYFERVQSHFAVLKVRGIGVMYMLIGMPTKKVVNGECYHYSSDADLRCMYLRMEEDIPLDDPRRNLHVGLFDAIRQMLSRKYMQSMWKSHMEFNFHVQGWPIEWFSPQAWKNESSPIQQFFLNIQGDYLPEEGTYPNYVYLSDQSIHRYRSELQKFWAEIKKQFHLKVLVYVPQKIKQKQLDLEQTYILWKNRIVTLQSIGFRSIIAEKKYFFYIYYWLEDTKQELNTGEFVNVLKNAIDEFAKSNSNNGNAAPAQ